MNTIVLSGSPRPDSDGIQTETDAQRDALATSTPTTSSEATLYDASGSAISGTASLTALYDVSGNYVGSYGFDPSSGFFSAWDAQGAETSLQALVSANNLPANSEPVGIDGAAGLVYDEKGRLVGLNVAGYVNGYSDGTTAGQSISGLQQVRSKTGTIVGSYAIQGGEYAAWDSAGTRLDAAAILASAGFSGTQIAAGEIDANSTALPSNATEQAIQEAFTRYFVSQGANQQSYLTASSSNSNVVAFSPAGSGRPVVYDSSGAALVNDTDLTALYNSTGAYVGSYGIDPTSGYFSAWDAHGVETSLQAIVDAHGLPQNAEAVSTSGQAGVLFSATGQIVGINVAGYVSNASSGSSSQVSVSGIQQVFSKDGTLRGSFGFYSGSNFGVWDGSGNYTDATSILTADGFSGSQISGALTALSGKVTSDTSVVADGQAVEQALTRYLLGPSPTENSYDVSAAQNATTIVLSGATRTVSSLSSSEISSLTDSQVAGMSTQQVQALSDTQVSALSTAQLEAAGASLLVLSQRQVQALNAGQLSTNTFHYLIADALSGQQLASLTDTQFQALSGDQLSSLTLDKFAAATSGRAYLLTDDQLSSLTTEQITYLAAPIASLTPSSIAGLVQSSTAAPLDISSYTTDQLGSLTPVELARVTDAQISALSSTAKTALGITASEYTDSQVEGFSASQLGALSASSLRSLTRAQISSLTSDQIVGLSAEQFADLTDYQLSGIGASQFQAILTSLTPDLNSLSTYEQSSAYLAADNTITGAQVSGTTPAAVLNLPAWFTSQPDPSRPTFTVGQTIAATLSGAGHVTVQIGYHDVQESGDVFQHAFLLVSNDSTGDYFTLSFEPSNGDPVHGTLTAEFNADSQFAPAFLGPTDEYGNPVYGNGIIVPDILGRSNTDTATLLLNQFVTYDSTKIPYLLGSYKNSNSGLATLLTNIGINGQSFLGSRFIGKAYNIGDAFSAPKVYTPGTIPNIPPASAGAVITQKTSTTGYGSTTETWATVTQYYQDGELWYAHIHVDGSSTYTTPDGSVWTLDKDGNVDIPGAVYNAARLNTTGTPTSYAPTQLQNLPADALQGASAEWLAGLSLADLEAIPAECFGGLTTQQLSLLSSDQLSIVSSKASDYFTSHLIDTVNSDFSTVQGIVNALQEIKSHNVVQGTVDLANIVLPANLAKNLGLGILSDLSSLMSGLKAGTPQGELQAAAAFARLDMTITSNAADKAFLSKLSGGLGGLANIITGFETGGVMGGISGAQGVLALGPILGLTSAVLLPWAIGVGLVCAFFGGHHDNPANMPDKYDTQSFGQDIADLSGSATANGAAFTENPYMKELFGGLTGMQKIEETLAQYGTAADAPGWLSDSFDSLKSMFGESATGSGQLNFGHAINNEWVTGATGTDGKTYQYSQLAGAMYDFLMNFIIGNPDVVADVNDENNPGPQYGGLEWNPIIKSDGGIAFEAGDGNGGYYYFGSDFKLYDNSYAGEVHTADLGSSIGDVRYYTFPGESPGQTGGYYGGYYGDGGNSWDPNFG